MTPSESFKPIPNFDSAINRAICQSEIEGGVDLDALPVGAVLEVETVSRTYRVENRGDGEVLISGHPQICPEPMLVNFYGSTWGTPLLKRHYVGRGMALEFQHPTRGLIRTSRIKDVREISQRPVS